jgi:hypothetical protein
MNKRTTIILSDELMQRAKQKAAEQNRTLTSLIEEGVRRVVSEPPAKGKRVLPRISKAKGWLRPGLTIADIEEMQELEYIERLKKL